MSFSPLPSASDALSCLAAQCKETIDYARKQRTAIRIQGKASKLGAQTTNGYAVLDMSSFSGILHYQPSELCITVLAGTPLQQCKQILADNGQQLAFDAVDVSASSIGGTVAANACGSKAYIQGKARDSLLGVSLLNSDSQLLRFGGELMKNVAGFDVTRLQCGAYGRLGVLASLTLRVCPRPQKQVHYVCSQPDISVATEQLHQLHAQQKAIVAAGWCEGKTVITLEGSAVYVEKHMALLDQKNARWKVADASVWSKFEQRTLVNCIDTQHLILCMYCQVDTAIDCIEDANPFCLDWFGTLRWYKLETSHYLRILSSGIFMRLVAEGVLCARVFLPHMLLHNVIPLDANLAGLHQRVLDAFDPHAMFNPDFLWHGV